MTLPAFTLRHKALLPVILLATMSVVYVSFSLFALFSQHRATLELADRVHEIQQLSELILRTQDLANPLLAQTAGRNTDVMAEFDATNLDIERLIGTLTENTAVNSHEYRLLETTRQQLAVIRQTILRQLQQASGHRDQQRAALEQLLTGPLLELRRNLLEWHSAELRQTDAIRDATENRLQALLIETGALVLLATLLLVGALWYYERILVKPLLALSHSTEILAAGNLKHRIRLNTRDEIGQLAGHINRMAGALHALTERLAQAAETDALTGLLNRRAFNTIVEYELTASRANHDSCTLALLDIDHFKKVNDTHGHAVGDAVLRHIATLCQQSIRRGDYCFRYGGEELAILMPSTNLEQALTMLERARQAIETTPLETDGKLVMATVSYGVATGPEDGNQRELLMQHADDALYRAKETGRNRGIAFRTMGKG